MSTESAICAACGESLAGHWTCKICHCFGHKNVQVQHDKAICKECDRALFQRGFRRCKGCSQVRPLSKFHRSPKSVYGRTCRACQGKRYADAHRARVQRWRERNREHVNAQARRYYHANLEKNAARRRAYRQAHPEQARAYYLSHQTEHRAKRRAYYWQNRETCLGRFRAWRERRKIARWKSLFGSAGGGRGDG